MRKILLTGGAGNVGSAMAQGLLTEPDTYLTVVDDLSTGNINKLPQNHPNLKFIKADVNNREEITDIMLSNQFDYVFHYAAYVGVQRTQENPIRVLKLLGSLILVGKSKSSLVRPFVNQAPDAFGFETPTHSDHGTNILFIPDTIAIIYPPIYVLIHLSVFVDLLHILLVMVLIFHIALTLHRLLLV